jgi:hypothetical protein
LLSREGRNQTGSVDENFKLKVLTEELKMTFLDLFANVNNNATRRTWGVDTSTDHADGVLNLHSFSSFFKGLADGVYVIGGRKIRSAHSSGKL